MSKVNSNNYICVSQWLAGAGLECSEEQVQKLSLYMDGILEWNDKVNLTAIKDPEAFVEKHYIDSLQVLNIADFQASKTVLDLGTGGGFPGVPLAIMCEDKELVLVDSLAKRLKIIDELAEKIGIRNIKTVHGRFEDLAHEERHREKHELVLSRAVAEMAVLAEYALPFTSVGGSLIAYKTAGEKLDEEIAAAEKAIKTLGGELIRIKKVRAEHALVIIKKNKPTPKKYPRKAGTPKKDPL